MAQVEIRFLFEGAADIGNGLAALARAFGPRQPVEAVEVEAEVVATPPAEPAPEPTAEAPKKRGRKPKAEPAPEPDPAQMDIPGTAPEPAPAAPATPSGERLTLNHVRTALTALELPKAKALVEAMGYKRISDVPESRFAELIERAKAGK